MKAGDYQLVSALFLRLLALVYLAAFVSIAVQIVALAGEQGILPLRWHLEGLYAQFGASAWWKLPGPFWLGVSDFALQATAWAGVAGALLMLLGLWPRLLPLLLFLLYLAMFQAGQQFMYFQWDLLLLEAGFLAIFLGTGSRWVIWLYRWLLFRLRFLSGLSKLLSGDASWAGLTALQFYFEVQPLPNPLSWHFHQLPAWLLQGTAAVVLVVEILVPLMMFLPRRFRLIAAWITIGHQLLIIASSNHNFFNFLTLALCLFLFDDQALRRALPLRLSAWLLARPVWPRPGPAHGPLLGRVLAAVVLTLSLSQMAEMILAARVPAPLAAVLDRLEAWRIANRYHVFPTMKTERVELVIEGSRDGVAWREYLLHHRPGDVRRRPGVVAPHQPRADWQLWFVEASPLFVSWFHGLLHRTLEGAPAVLALYAVNPFPEAPPRWLRVSRYQYRFADPATHAATGQWWTRQYLGPFEPLPLLRLPPAGRH